MTRRGWSVSCRSQALTDPPGAPPGPHTQLYESPFSGAGRAVANVMLVRDGEPGWRWAGYRTQPSD
jgi:hypothetical protein